MSIESSAILEAIRALPRTERLRLVEKVMHELGEDAPEPSGDPSAIIGMMADEPEVMDRVSELASQARRSSRMRTVDG